jgi:pimeloyl-ACP methyl ester carboxylesterase
MDRFGSNNFWLGVALASMLISGIGAALVQSSCGRVAVKDMRWETRSGKTLSALLYKPKSATVEHPAPAVVVSHGWWNNREMQDACALELSRRGFVVVSIDMYGHGNSDYLRNEDAAVGGTGMYDAVRLVADLPCVDRGRIGVSGHSSGATAADYSVQIDNAAQPPLIAAVMLVDNDPVYTDSEGRYTNFYGHRHIGLIAALYDEFYFRQRSANGDVMTSPRDYIKTPNAQSFLHFGADPAKLSDRRCEGTFYSQENVLRIVYTPWETHPWGTISRSTVQSQIAFFDRALGSPMPIPGESQVWQIKLVFTSLGLLGFAMFLVTFARALLNTQAFAALKCQPLPPPQFSSAGDARFWAGLIVLTVVSGASYVLMSDLRWFQAIAFNRAPSIFKQGAVFFIAVWEAANGLATLLVLAILRRQILRRDPGLLRAAGILPGWRPLMHGIALAAIVVAAAYQIVFLLDYFFKTDFRLWVIAVKTFTPDKLWMALLYGPMFAVYFMINSVFVNCFNRFAILGREWLNLAVLALFNSLAAILLVAAQYTWIFITGHPLRGFSSIFGVWLFPVILILGVSAIVSRKIYNSTNNPYIGGFVNTVVVSLIAVTNTFTVAN